MVKRPRSSIGGVHKLDSGGRFGTRKSHVAPSVIVSERMAQGKISSGNTKSTAPLLIAERGVLVLGENPSTSLLNPQ
jgi:hypothetical protein